ncbi:DsbA family oxidoreductase [Kribbella sp. CA-247076]|uniref:DsbA family oxidoreductase n=1 Tax=Kribbella sp. CA-247076 TaxID=3239941 RepID=UPI003D8B31AE
MVVEHWFDFVCPYCYVAQDRNRILRDGGLEVVEHGIRIHPEIRPGGKAAGPRVGPAYDFLTREAEAAGLPLRWPARLPYTRTALAAHAWLNSTRPKVAQRFAESVFTAHFAQGQDIESVNLLATLAEAAGGSGTRLRTAFADRTAYAALERSERQAKEYGVTGTPTWNVLGQSVSGLRPRAWFRDLTTVLRPTG